MVVVRRWFNATLIRAYLTFSWQKMSIQWMTAAWSICWRGCASRTKGSSRLPRSVSSKCVQGELLMWTNINLYITSVLLQTPCRNSGNHSVYLCLWIRSKRQTRKANLNWFQSTCSPTWVKLSLFFLASTKYIQFSYYEYLCSKC